MIKASSVRKMLKEAGSGRKFKETLHRQLGIRYNPRTQQRYIDKPEIGVDEFSIRELSEHFLGQQFVSELHGGGMSSSAAQTLQKASTAQERALFEDIAGVDPTAMQDINAYTATVAGLVEVKLLEGYRSPEFIGDKLVEVMPRRQNGGKMIGIPYANPNLLQAVQPGIEFPSLGLSQLYVWARPNLVVGGKLALDRETVVYDLSGELMAAAESGGKALQFVREYIIAGGIYGLTNVSPLNSNVHPKIAAQIGNSFLMNQQPSSTPNATYQTAGVTTNGNFYNYTNQQSLTLSDWTSLRSVRNLLNLMRDPVNQLPFDTEITDILADPYLAPVVQYIRHQQSVMRSTGTPATAPDQGAGSTFPPQLTHGTEGLGKEAQNFDFNLHWSNIFHQVLLDGGVTEANAQKYSVCGSPKKSFVWQQAWDLRTDQANPTDSEMLSKNIIGMWVTQWSGQFVVREPRYCVLNTN